MKYDVKNIKQADRGEQRIRWAAREMPVLRQITADFRKRKALKGVKIAACLHVTSETANLMLALKAGGAKLALCASNPLSTQDEVAAALAAKHKIPVFAYRGVGRKKYYEHLNRALDLKPNITMDDGADLVSLLHTERTKQVKDILGSSEETTTGVIRLRSLEQEKKLKFPVIAVNDSKTKYMFDNRYGTGQSTIDGILRATNLLLAGRKFVVAGYGWCGRGIAMRARGMGAHVSVCEVDPVKALEAHHDGFTVLPMEQASQVGEIFVSATGDINVINIADFERMQDGAVVANAGHFDVELNMKGLSEMAQSKEEVRPNLVGYKISKDKTIFVVADGRLVNLSSAEGHPASVMDMSFAGQALAAQYIKKNHKKLKKQVYALPVEVEQEIAARKLDAMGVAIDKLTDEQKKYLSSWELGT